MPTAAIKYSQPTNTVQGEPSSVASRLAAWKIKEKALLEILGGYKDKQAIKPSSTSGNYIDWVVNVEVSDGSEQNNNRNTRASNNSNGVSPEVINTAVNSSSAIGGSGDPSEYLKTSVPKAVKELLKYIISSWKGGYGMNAHNTAMQKLAMVQTLLSQLSSMIPTAIPDGIPACSTGLQIYQQIVMVIQNTFLKMPQQLTTSDVQQAVSQMNEINSLNQTFSSQISAIVICQWMKLPPGLKLPTAFTNSTIIIQAMNQIYNDWISGGSTMDKFDTVEQLLDTVQA